MILYRYLLLLFSVIFVVGCNVTVDVEGKGLVVSDPEIIQCRENSGVCFVEDYEDLDLDIEDLIVTFRALPDEGYALVKWEGDCEQVLANKCYATLGSDVDIKAIFKPISYASGPGQTDKEVRFVALGDTGEGNLAQYRVADAMEQVCQERGCDFAMGLGDNFYNGTPDNPYSPLFEERFEMPYQNLDIPFYMILGNHDTGRFRDGDGGDQALGENQVAYSYRSDRSSDKWRMPARYYRFSYPQPLPLVDFFALDSAPFVGLIDPNPVYEVDDYAAQEGNWLNKQLLQSSGDWKIAFGHHPYISNGTHGNAGNYDKSLPGGQQLDKTSGKIFKDFMEDYVCNRVDLYLSGHDHNLQALRPVMPCGKTEFVVSGAGSKANGFEKAGDNVNHLQVDKKVGFFYFYIKGNTLSMTAYTVNPTDGSYQVHGQKTLQRKLKLTP